MCVVSVFLVVLRLVIVVSRDYRVGVRVIVLYVTLPLDGVVVSIVVSVDSILGQRSCGNECVRLVFYDLMSHRFHGMDMPFEFTKPGIIQAKQANSDAN